MAPSLGDEERVVPQGFRAISHVQNDRTSRLHGRQADGQLSSGHQLMIRLRQPDVKASPIDTHTSAAVSGSLHRQ